MMIIRHRILFCIPLLLALAVLSCRPDNDVDYDFQALKLDGEYNGPIGDDGEYNYFITLSDIGFDSAGRSLPGGTYYRFDIFADVPSDTSRISVPSGRYTLGARNATASGTFTPDRSLYFVNDDSAAPETQLIFSQGHIDIRYNGDICVLTAEITDVGGMTHHISYTGDVSLLNHSSGSGEFLPMDQDRYIYSDRIMATDYGLAGDGRFHNIMISITDMLTDKEGYVIPPGNILNMDCYMSLDQDGILPGRYELSQDYWGTQDFTLSPGEISNDSFVGTIVTYYDTQDRAWLGLMKSGMLIVDREKTDDSVLYTLAYEFYTEDGYMAIGSYEGPITIDKETAVQSSAPGGNSFSRPEFNPMTRRQFLYAPFFLR